MKIKTDININKIAIYLRNVLKQHLEDESAYKASIIIANSLQKSLIGESRSSPQDVYLLMRELYWKSKGQINDYISALSCLYNPNIVDASNKYLTRTQCGIILNELHTEGYSIVHDAFSRSFIENLKANVFNNLGYNKSGVVARIMASRESLLKCNLLKELSTSNDFKYIASMYIGCDATLNRLAAWRTIFNQTSIDLSGDAMMYHYDHDHNRHLKFFVYITDVYKDTGPHVYIPNTARKNIPSFVYHSGRYSDEEIKKNGLQSREIIGQAGTLIVADTQNLHKGTPIHSSNGSRDIIEFQYVDLPFGKGVPKIQWLT